MDYYYFKRISKKEARGWGIGDYRNGLWG